MLHRTNTESIRSVFSVDTYDNVPIAIIMNTKKTYCFEWGMKMNIGFLYDVCAFFPLSLRITNSLCFPYFTHDAICCEYTCRIRHLSHASIKSGNSLNVKRWHSTAQKEKKMLKILTYAIIIIRDKYRWQIYNISAASRSVDICSKDNLYRRKWNICWTIIKLTL